MGFALQYNIFFIPKHAAYSTKHHVLLDLQNRCCLQEAVNRGFNEQVSVGNGAVESVGVKRMQLFERLRPKITAVWCKIKFKKTFFLCVFYANVGTMRAISAGGRGSQTEAAQLIILKDTLEPNKM